MREDSRIDLVSTYIIFALKWYSRWTLYRLFAILQYMCLHYLPMNEIIPCNRACLIRDSEIKLWLGDVHLIDKTQFIIFIV